MDGHETGQYYRLGRNGACERRRDMRAARARGQYSVINTLKKHAADEILFCRDIRTLHSPGLAGADPIIRDPAAIFARLAMPLRIWTHPARESAGRGNTGALNDNNFLKGGDDTK
jgi:hypothetical protein